MRWSSVEASKPAALVTSKNTVAQKTFLFEATERLAVRNGWVFYESDDGDCWFCPICEAVECGDDGGHRT